MPRLKKERSWKGSEELQGKVRSGVMAFIPKLRWIWRKKHEERWLDSWRIWNSVGDGRNKLHERGAHCAYAFRWFVCGKLCERQRLRTGKNIVLSGMSPMGVIEELDALCGRLSLEMERFNHHAGGDQGAVALVLDMTNAPQRVSLPVVWARATHFTITSSAGTSSTSGEFGLKDVWRSRFRPSRPFSQGLSGVACSCASRCRTHWVRSHNVSAPEIDGFCGWDHGFCECEEQGRGFWGSWKQRQKKRAWSCRSSMEGKSKAITLASIWRKGFRNEAGKKELLWRRVLKRWEWTWERRPNRWEKRRWREEKCDVRFSEILHENWCEKSVEDGFGSREKVERTSRGHRTYRKVDIEEANGSSSGKGGVGSALTLLGEVKKGWSLRKKFPPWPRLLGRKGSGRQVTGPPQSKLESRLQSCFFFF